MEQRELTLAPESVGLRLDRWLAEQCPDISRSQLQNLIEVGSVTCNGSPLNKKDKLKAGQTILLTLPDPQPIEAQPQNIPLDIVYEDNSLLVVNKPKGMVVHPAPGNPDGTMVNALLWHCAGRLSGIGGAIRPGIVHRIDKDTSGLLVVAKTDAAHQALTEQMSVHSIHRVYHAVVYGNLKEDTGFVEAPIGRDPKDRKKMARDPAELQICLHRLAGAGTVLATLLTLHASLKQAAPIKFGCIWRPLATRWLGMPCMGQKIVSAA